MGVQTKETWFRIVIALFLFILFLLISSPLYSA